MVADYHAKETVVTDYRRSVTVEIPRWLIAVPRNMLWPITAEA